MTIALLLSFGVAAVLAMQAGSTAFMPQTEATGLDCMASSYDVEQLATIEKLSLSIEQYQEGEGGISDEFISIASLVASKCQIAEAWNPEIAEYAVAYEATRLMEVAYRNSGELSRADLARIDATLAAGDQAALWEVMESGVMAGVQEAADEDLDIPMTPDQAQVLSNFIAATKIQYNDAIGARMGALLGMMAMQRMVRREFESAEGGQ